MPQQVLPVRGCQWDAKEASRARPSSPLPDRRAVNPWGCALRDAPIRRRRRGGERGGAGEGDDGGERRGRGGDGEGRLPPPVVARGTGRGRTRRDPEGES